MSEVKDESSFNKLDYASRRNFLAGLCAMAIAANAPIPLPKETIKPLEHTFNITYKVIMDGLTDEQALKLGTIFKTEISL